MAQVTGFLPREMLVSEVPNSASFERFLDLHQCETIGIVFYGCAAAGDGYSIETKPPPGQSSFDNVDWLQ